MKIVDIDETSGGFTLEQMLIQKAQESLAEVMMFLGHAGRFDLVIRIQEIKDDLSCESFKMLGEDLVCAN